MAKKETSVILRQISVVDFLLIRFLLVDLVVEHDLGDLRPPVEDLLAASQEVEPICQVEAVIPSG